MPIEHPEPTEATVKELYANAWCCAKPGCRRPLYTVDQAAGTRTRNSVVSHIHSRRENGPRWLKTMSAEENRSVRNLLLLCIEHSFEVDERKREADFPPELMFAWKAQQLADFDAIGNGWKLTDAEAADLAKASFGGIVIAESQVNLGGAGGQASGAGGGGGGALGHGAVAGAGGSGGDVYNLNGTPGAAPGAGGGGGGAEGEGAIAGEGGSGGETVHRQFWSDELPETVEITVGDGGLGGVNGGDGEPGGESTIGQFAVARGGRPASQPAPEQHIRSTPSLSVGSLVLADFAEIHNELLNVLRGGWSFCSGGTFPYLVRGYVVGTVEIGSDTVPGSYPLAVELATPERVICRVSVRLDVAVDRPPISRVPLVTPVEGRAEEPGLWTVRVAYQSTELASTSFMVM